MEEKILENYLKAGSIAANLIKFGSGLVKKDALVLDIAEQIDAKILELGVEPAFPVNISINDISSIDHVGGVITDFPSMNQ